MTRLLELKLRFSDAVYAIETTPKSLRKWLQNPDVALFTEDEDSKGWKNFSFGDIALLALMRKAVDYGFTASEANEIAINILRMFPQVFRYRNMPYNAMPAVWMNRKILLWKDGDAWQIELRDNWKGNPEPSDAYIVIDVYRILRRALQRAVESNSDGEAESEGGE